MKKVFFSALLVLFAFSYMRAQTKTMEKDTLSLLKSFSAKYNLGNVYLKWIVSNLRSDGLFIIYRSTDGINYDVIGYKNAVSVPVPNDIAYYFTDEAVISKTIFYKILAIEKSSDYFFSSAISVPTIQEEICHASK